MYEPQSVDYANSLCHSAVPSVGWTCLLCPWKQRTKLEISTQRVQTSAKAMSFARWRHHICFASGSRMLVPVCPLWRNGNKNLCAEKCSGIWDFFPDHPQNWTTGSLCHARHTLKISERSVHNFLSYVANRQTDKQTNKNRQKHYLLGGGNK